MFYMNINMVSAYYIFQSFEDLSVCICIFYHLAVLVVNYGISNTIVLEIP